MQNVLVYESTTRQRWINGKLYEFTRYIEPGHRTHSPYAEIIVRRWSGRVWEKVHIFSR